MEEGLGVAPNRGVIRFLAIPDENFATNGKTIAGDIEELEKREAENNTSLQRSLSRSTPKSKRRQSLMSLRGAKNQLATHNEVTSPTPPVSERETPPLPPIPIEKSPLDLKAEKVQKMGRRRSFIATIFGKAG